MHFRGLVPTALALGLALGTLCAPAASAATTFTCGLTVNCATLTVVPDGPGSGTITSAYTKTSSGALKRLDCLQAAGVVSGTCSLMFSWSLASTSDTVAITGTAADGSLACTALSTCRAETVLDQIDFGFDAGATEDVPLGFQLATRELHVTATGVGTGSVAASWSGGANSCVLPSNGCNWFLPYGTVVTLKANPDAGAVFGGWTGTCAGQSVTCMVTLKSAFPTVIVPTNVVLALPGPSPTLGQRQTASPRPAASQRQTTAPSSTATPGQASGPPTSQRSTAAASSSAVPAPGASAPPGLASAADSTLPVWVVLVIAVLALIVGGLTIGLVVALRRKPS